MFRYYKAASEDERKIFKKCSEKVIDHLLRGKKLAIYQTCIEDMLKRGISLDLLKRCINCLPNGKHPDLVASICNAVTNKKVFSSTSSKRVLVVAAWKFGNSENYFKLLPKELVDQILSYDSIDEPPYFSALDLVARKITEDDKISGRRGEAFIPYFWKNWGSLYTSKTALQVAKEISDANYTVSEKQNLELLSWLRKIITSNKLRMDIKLDNYQTSNLTKYLMTSTTKEAFALLKLLVEHKILTAPSLEDTRSNVLEKETIPTSWLSVLHKNFDVISYLIEQDLLPEVATDREITTLEAFCTKKQLGPTMLEYLAECRRKRAK